MEKECFEVLLLVLDLMRGDLVHKDHACRRAAAQMLSTTGASHHHPICSASTSNRPVAVATSIVQPLAALLGSKFGWIPDDTWIALEVYQTASRLAEEPALFDADAHARLTQFAEDLSTFQRSVAPMDADTTEKNTEPCPPPSVRVGDQVAEGVRAVGRNLLEVLRRISPSSAAAAGVKEVKDLLRALRRVAANRAVVALVLLTMQLKQRHTMPMSDTDVAAANELLAALFPFSTTTASSTVVTAEHAPHGSDVDMAPQGHATRKRARDEEGTIEHGRSAPDGAAAKVSASQTPPECAALSATHNLEFNNAPPAVGAQKPLQAAAVLPSSPSFEEALRHAFDTPMRAALPSRQPPPPVDADGTGCTAHDPTADAKAGDSDDGSSTDDSSGDDSADRGGEPPQRIALRPADASFGNGSLQLPNDKTTNDNSLADPNVSDISNHNNRSAASSGIDVSVVCDVERARPIKPRPAILRTPSGKNAGAMGSAASGSAFAGSRSYFLDPVSQKFYPTSIAGFFD